MLGTLEQLGRDTFIDFCQCLGKAVSFKLCIFVDLFVISNIPHENGHYDRINCTLKPQVSVDSGLC